MLYAILIFGVLIFVHELGHFIAAKSFNVKVHEFSLGMGPAILKKQGKETLYALRLLPIGGFVKLEGEDGDSDDERSFGKLSPIKKIIVLISGAFMNILTGFLFFVILFSFSQGIATNYVGEVIEGTPAYNAGIKAGDKIISINGSAVHLHEDVSFTMSMCGGKECTVKVLRDNEVCEFKILPKSEGGTYILGYRPLIKDKTLGGILYSSYYNTFFVIRLVFESLKMMFSGQAKLSDMSGPVGIVSEVGKAAQYGWVYVLNFGALIAVNLGVMNLLPFPALDGGRVVFAIIEAIRRKPVSAKIEGYVNAAGLILLLCLMVAVTFSDIFKLFS